MIIFTNLNKTPLFRSWKFMKHLFFLFLLSHHGKAHSQAALEWVQLSSFDTIDFPGQKLVFKQSCIHKADSIIANGSATFLRADIAGIGTCSFSTTFKDTIISKVELFSSDKKSRDQFLAYFTALTNNQYTIIPDKKTHSVYRLFHQSGTKSKSSILQLQKQKKDADYSNRC